MQFVTKLDWFHLIPNVTLHMCKLIHKVQTSGELGFKAENYCLVITISECTHRMKVHLRQFLRVQIGTHEDI